MKKQIVCLALTVYSVIFMKGMTYLPNAGKMAQLFFTFHYLLLAFSMTGLLTGFKKQKKTRLHT